MTESNVVTISGLIKVIGHQVHISKRHHLALTPRETVVMR